MAWIVGGFVLLMSGAVWLVVISTRLEREDWHRFARERHCRVTVHDRVNHTETWTCDDIVVIHQEEAR